MMESGQRRYLSQYEEAGISVSIRGSLLEATLEPAWQSLCEGSAGVSMTGNFMNGRQTARCVKRQIRGLYFIRLHGSGWLCKDQKE